MLLFQFAVDTTTYATPFRMTAAAGIRFSDKHLSFKQLKSSDLKTFHYVEEVQLKRQITLLRIASPEKI